MKSEHPERAAITQAETAAATKQPQVWTVRALLAWMTPFLKARDIESARVISEILLAEVLKVERMRLYMEPERELDADELTRLRALVARAARHEPVQFLVGKWPFFGRDFEVEPCTLIPRPCTEVLVERALAWHRERGATSVRVLDLCTGTGCIAVSLALGLRAIARPSGVGCSPLKATREDAERIAHAHTQADDRADVEPRASRESGGGVGGTDVDKTIHVTATDLSQDAIALAQRNAKRLGAAIDFHIGDLFDALGNHHADGGCFDLIVSNPPYVTDAEYLELDANVREYEPALALRGGRDGLDLVRRVVDGARTHLAPGGLLLVEIGWKQSAAALALVAGREWRDARVLSDGDGHPRILEVCRA